MKSKSSIQRSRRISDADQRRINKELDIRIAQARKTREELGEFLAATDIKEEKIRGKSYYVVRDPQRQNKIVDKLEKKRGVDKQVAFSRFNKRFKTFDPNIVSIDEMGRTRTGENVSRITTKQPSKKFGDRFQALYSAAAIISFSDETRKNKLYPKQIKTPILRGFSPSKSNLSLPIKRAQAKTSWYGAIVEYLKERYGKATVERLVIGSKQSYLITPINAKERTIYYALR